MTYSLKLVEIRKETYDTITLVFKQPAFKKINYLPGQYLTLIFRINGRRYFRPYSFSSSPLIDTLLEVTVKRVFNGIVSNHIHDKVVVGDTIETLPPMGKFVFDKNCKKKQIFLWGGGSGITPLMSIGKSALGMDNNFFVTLIYCNRNFETTIFKGQIQSLQEKYLKNFKCIHFHSKAELLNKENIISTRINVEEIKKLVLQYQVEEGIHYICGPNGLKQCVSATLKNLNVSDNDIFFEEFEATKDPEDFVDIVTRNVQVEFQGVKEQVEVIRGKSILEAALDIGIEIPYSCQTGNCNSCKAKLVEGNFKVLGNAKDRDDLKDDEVLLCSSYPLSDNLKLQL